VRDMTRRDVLRASAGAAAAVPIAALGVDQAEAAEPIEGSDLAILDKVGKTPVVFAIHNPKRGDMSILRGTKEVRVRNRRLVARILKAAKTSKRLSRRPRGRARFFI